MSAVPETGRRVIWSTTATGVSRFVSQPDPEDSTNRRTRPRVTAIAHDQRTRTLSLPDSARVLDRISMDPERVDVLRLGSPGLSD